MFHRFIGKTQPDPNCLCCVLSTAQVCLQEAKLQHAACTLLSKCNLQACESRARACKRLGACTELFLHTLHPPAHTGRQAPQVGDTRLREGAALCLYTAALIGWLCLSLVKSPGRRLVWFLPNASVSGRRAQGVLWTGWGGSALLVGEGGCPVFLKTIDVSEYCWKDLAFWIRQSKFILWKIYPEGQGPLGIYSYRSL